MMKLLELFEEVTGADQEYLKSYQEVKNYLQQGERLAGFGSYERVPILRQDEHYMITLTEFFEESGDTSAYPITREEVLFRNMTSGSDWEHVSGGYTYNSPGALERDVRFILVKDMLEDDYIVFFSVHVGLDARAGFTDWFAMSVDDEYDLDIMLGTSYIVASGTVEYKDGNKEDFSISASPAHDEQDIYFHDSGESWFGWFDLYDKEELTGSIKEVIKEGDKEVTSITID